MSDFGRLSNIFVLFPGDNLIKRWIATWPHLLTHKENIMRKSKAAICVIGFVKMYEKKGDAISSATTSA
jgi:hypothetical protein